MRAYVRANLTIQGVSQEGLEAVNNRQNALNIKTSLQMAQTSTKEVLMLSRRGRAIADLLVEHLREYLRQHFSPGRESLTICQRLQRCVHVGSVCVTFEACR